MYAATMHAAAVHPAIADGHAPAKTVLAVSS